MAVFVFLKAFNDFFSSFRPTIKHCIYFSDGAPQQFKNSKHFSTIYYHKQDFDRTAIWHFQDTAHGKGPCDHYNSTNGLFAILRYQISPLPTELKNLTMKQLTFWRNVSMIVKRYQVRKKYTVLNQLRIVNCKPELTLVVQLFKPSAFQLHI